MRPKDGHLHYPIIYELAIDLGHVSHKVEHTIGVADFVVIPADYLDEVVADGDTCLLVEDAAVGVTEEVAADNIVFGIGQDVSQFTFRGTLHLGTNLFVRCRLFQIDGEVHDGNVKRGHAHRHTREFAFKRRDNAAYGLGSTRAGRDDVATSSTATAPVLHRRTIYGDLRCRHSMYGGHQAIDDAPLIVEYLHHGGKAVGRAGSVGNDGRTLGVFALIDTANKHGRIVFGRC